MFESIGDFFALFQEHSYKFVFPIGVRLVAHSDVEPCVFLYHRFCVAECLERLFAVVAAHAAVANSAKWQIGGGYMYDCIVYAAASKWYFAQKMLLDFLVASEKV